MAIAFLFAVLSHKRLLNQYQLISIILILIICFFTMSINGVFDVIFPWNFIEIILFYPLVSLLLYKILNVGYKNILILLYLSIVTQSIIMYVMSFMPSIKSFYSSLLLIPLPSDYYPHRHIGLTGFSSYNMGVFLNLSLPLCLIITQKYKSVYRFKLLLYLSCFLVLMISLFVSRSSMIVFACFAFSVYISVGFRKKLLFIVCILTAFAAFYFNKSFLNIFKEFSNAVEWAFTPIIEISNGRIPHGLRVLFDQYWIPDSCWTLLIGDGLTTGKYGYYMHTDGGYMRLILYFGAVGTAISLICLFLPFISYFLDHSRNHIYFTLFMTIFISLIIIQYKGNVIIDGSELFKVFYLLVFTPFLSHKYLKRI
jgi:hypothetical protein